MPKKGVKVKVYAAKRKNTGAENDFIQQLQEKYSEKIDLSSVKTFSDFPLSPKTIKGLKSSGYNKPTDIQKETLLLALKGKDILGAAQTGSGKTLAFLIPVLEKLFCKQWTHLDGLGALVITPTRELAYQIFETLRKIGRFHDFSAGLVIGGKDLAFERTRVDQCNIIICTPGRLLQHMDENPLFDAVNLQVLVLDEADRCLDMGFEATMNAIIANLPVERQTFLFSATQTRSVKDLARLSLTDPSYVSVHENAKHSTPPNLEQSYIVCELHEKLAILWSFIKNHLKQKCIVFMSSCKQVKYTFEIFSKLRPGVSLMALYGTLHQLKRMEVYESFARKQSAVLFATDIAARGLDFPAVHWVVQVDCPEDSATYIHRVGRTARYHKGGESLLLLQPSELEMLNDLNSRKIPINQIDVNATKINDPVRKIEAFLASNPSLKESGKRAFLSYIKSVALMKNKKIFDVNALDTDAYARSLGLAIPPRIRFLQRAAKRNAPSLVKLKEPEREQNANFCASNDSDDDTILTVKRENHDVEIPEDIKFDETSRGRNSKKPVTKAALVRQIIKKNIVANQKITFDDETGEAVLPKSEKRSRAALEYENEDVSGIDLKKARMALIEEDKYDRKLFREKVKAKHREKKLKLKKMKERKEYSSDDGEEDSAPPVLLKMEDSEQEFEEPDESEAEIEPESEPEVLEEKTKSKKTGLNVNETEELAMMLLKN